MEENKKPTDTTITRNTANFSQLTNNIYETVALLTKRANQITIAEKKELKKKIEEFAETQIDAGDEMIENREQVEIVRQFEMRPKPTLQAIDEYLNDEIFYRNPAKEDQRTRRIEDLENDIIAESQDAENTEAKKAKSKKED